MEYVHLNFKEIVATETGRTLKDMSEGPFSIMTSRADTKNVTLADGSQMIMTSSGEIMTGDQFNALTTLADMTSQQEEVKIEPRVQQVNLLSPSHFNRQVVFHVGISFFFFQL